MATISDALGLRVSSGPNKYTIEVPYKVFGATNATDAQVALAAGTPDVLGNLKRSLVDAEEGEAGAAYDGKVTYELPDGMPKQTGETAFNFDTSGGTQHIINDLSTSGSYPPPDGSPGAPPAYDPLGMINASPDGVSGVDITVPQFAFTVTQYMPASNVTATFVGDLYKLTGSVNGSNITMVADGITLGFQAGELLGLGSTGARRGIGDVELSHRFAFSPNQINISIDAGGFLVSSKKGWEYLEIVAMPATMTANIVFNGSNTAGTFVRTQPVAAVVHKVYKDGDFTKYLIPSS